VSPRICICDVSKRTKMRDSRYPFRAEFCMASGTFLFGTSGRHITLVNYDPCNPLMSRLSSSLSLWYAGPLFLTISIILYLIMPPVRRSHRAPKPEVHWEPYSATPQSPHPNPTRHVDFYFFSPVLYSSVYCLN
jgi:hypothetical protein